MCSSDLMIGRMNSDLANAFGNLAQRTLSIIQKNCEGKVPKPGAFASEDAALTKAAHDLLPTLRELMAEPAFHRALTTIWEVIAEANRYIDTAAPWSLAKTDRARMETVLYTLVETIRVLAILTQPFMPTSVGRILDQLAVPNEARNFAALGHALKPGTPLPKPEGVFPRYVEPGAEPVKGKK